MYVYIDAASLTDQQVVWLLRFYQAEAWWTSDTEMPPQLQVARHTSKPPPLFTLAPSRYYCADSCSASSASSCVDSSVITTTASAAANTASAISPKQPLYQKIFAGSTAFENLNRSRTDFVGSVGHGGSGSGSGSHHRRRSSSTKPGHKKALNCFMLWSKTKRQQLAQQNPGVNNSELSKILATMWKDLPRETRLQYKELAMAQRQPSAELQSGSLQGE